MKIKTSDLIGAALNWAVAKCEMLPATIVDNGLGFNVLAEGHDFSANWEQGGPIIERELIEITPIFHSAGWQCQDGRWLWQSCLLGSNNLDDNFESFGNSPLIAAMRCYVASKLGDEVEIPDELC